MVQQRIHVRHQSTRPFLNNFALSYVKGGLSDPEVDPRPHDCSKLWSLRSCSPSLSSTSLSWCTGRFPWSLSFSSCSTLTRWSTLVVQVSFTRPLCATTDAHGRRPHAVHRLGWTSLCCCSDQFQLSASTAGMTGRFFRALHTGAGPGVVSTGTRPP